jgi:hypothetical protein
MAFGQQAAPDILSSSSSAAADEDDDTSDEGEQQPQQLMALFAIGSKAEHSCCPNLTWTTNNGKMECVSECWIHPGDRLSISYVANVFERPCQERRAALQENKFFLCNCQRCRGLDNCRTLWCNCKENGILLWSGQKKAWVCTSCDRSQIRDEFLTSSLQAEAELEERIQELEWRIHNEQPCQTLLHEILAVTKSDRWKATLHPSHFLNVSVYKLISTASALIANVQMMQESFPPPIAKFSPLLRLFAVALLKQIKWVEKSIYIAREGLDLQNLVSCEGLLKDSFGNGKKCSDLDYQEEKEDGMKEWYSHFSAEGADTSQVSALLDVLCCDEYPEYEAILGESGTGSHVADSAFHAGQNLILAGNPDLALKLYKRYSPCIQRCTSVSVDDRARLRTFVNSNGQENPFESPLAY